MNTTSNKSLTERLNQAAQEEECLPLSLKPTAELNDLIDKVMLMTTKSNDKYWDVHEIANYLGVSITTVNRHFTSDPRWPQPIMYGEKQPSKRWLASEVKRALLLFRG